MLEEIRAKHQLPALAAAAVIDGQVVVLGTTGTRKVGGREKVTDADLWHIGSDTKSMTASLAAVLVEEGKIKWETTVADVFPAYRSRMNDAWKAVTLEQLLTNRSGAPGEPPADLWQTAWKKTGSPINQRLDFVRGLVERPTEAPPGTKYIYSNQGFSIAGAMLEKVAGKPFEKLMAERLFTPLGLKTAGFGAPGDARRVDQPWGHTGTGANFKPVPPGPAADNPPTIRRQSAGYRSGGPRPSLHRGLRQLRRLACAPCYERQGTAQRRELCQAAHGSDWTGLRDGMDRQRAAVGWRKSIQPLRFKYDVACRDVGGARQECCLRRGDELRWKRSEAGLR